MKRLWQRLRRKTEYVQIGMPGVHYSLTVYLDPPGNTNRRALANCTNIVGTLQHMQLRVLPPDPCPLYIEVTAKVGR